jgi:hypothetical protein
MLYRHRHRRLWPPLREDGTYTPRVRGGGALRRRQPAVRPGRTTTCAPSGRRHSCHTLHASVVCLCSLLHPSPPTPPHCAPRMTHLARSDWCGLQTAAYAAAV